MIPFDISLSKIWRSWYHFRKGKTKTKELEFFEFYLERNLSKLHQEIANGSYRHGLYRKFTVCDNKKREISVASVRDKVVHRLLYDYLVEIYDKTFIFDAWSCRAGKGVFAAILRAQDFLAKNPKGFVWRADITRFFDNVDQRVLWRILRRKIIDKRALYLLREVIKSFLKKDDYSLSLSLSLSLGKVCRLAM